MKFLRQQAHYKKRIALNWRKPKGHHSKLREKRRGLHQMPCIGFKKSDDEREFIKPINNVNDLKLFKKGDKVVISRTIGAKKRIELINLCLKNGLIIANYKKPADKVKVLKESFDKRVKDKKKKVKVIKKVEPKKEVKKKVVVKKKSVKVKKKEVKE